MNGLTDSTPHGRKAIAPREVGRFTRPHASGWMWNVQGRARERALRTLLREALQDGPHHRVLAGPWPCGSGYWMAVTVASANPLFHATPPPYSVGWPGGP